MLSIGFKHDVEARIEDHPGGTLAGIVDALDAAADVASRLSIAQSDRMALREKIKDCATLADRLRSGEI